MYMHNISLLVCNYKRTCVNNNELKMKMKRIQNLTFFEMSLGGAFYAFTCGRFVL